jgi:predicted NBD/HSP70 family sugar kinase
MNSPLEIVRALTDEHVLRALMRHPRLTRAELATVADISKPTAGESVRRLTEAGLVVDTGERTPGGRGRGRVGSYYALAPGIGTALAVDISPEGVVAECVDAYGETVARATEPVSRPADPAQVSLALREVGAAMISHGGTAPRLAVVSAADPVDRNTGRLVHLPDSPFLVGELDPVKHLGGYVTGPVTVDNDVNWAARAERDGDPDLRDFAYLYLGEGLGCAIVSDGEIRRGHAGLAGEIAHLITTGPDGSATHLIQVFDQLGLRRPNSTAIDTARLLTALTADTESSAQLREAVATAVSGALAAILAIADPSVIVLGGSWGSHPAMVEAIGRAFARAPRHAPVRAAAIIDRPALAGARQAAITNLQASIIASG